MDGWTRLETDGLGDRRLPGEALYGIHSLRAAENFPVSGRSVRHLAPLLQAMALTKKAAASANARLGKLTPDKAAIIGRVCDELMAGQHGTHFIVDVMQGGGGTSSHMNMNEVIANRGLELMGHPCGSYQHLDPIRDVNLSQSTTDVHSTALRLALMQGAVTLEQAVLALSDSFATRASAFRDMLKLARTHLQDALPMTLGEEFGAFAAALRQEARRIAPAAAELASLNLGGTMAGTGLTAQPDFAEAVIAELRYLTGLPLKRADDLVCAAWSTADLVQFSAMLRGLAMVMSKVASDLRLLASGPHGGLAEISLPAVQAGSPVVSGKINPVVPEMVNQVAFQVAGSDVAVGMAAEAGQLQRNVFEPLMAQCLISNMSMLENAALIFATRCVSGVAANRTACAGNLSAVETLSAGLPPLVGPEAAAHVVAAVSAGGDLRELLRRHSLSGRKDDD